MPCRLLILLTCCCLGCTKSQPVPNNLPADWPPLPDFKHPVDYVKWLQNRLRVPPEEDAQPLYEKIFSQNGDSEAIQKAKRQMWGEDDKWQLPGLFTGYQETSERYAWSPVDHADWERSYQTQVAAGLTAKLIDIARFKHMNQPFGLSDPQEMFRSAGRNETQPSNQPVDVGLTVEDRVLLAILLPSGANGRRAARVLMQDAWRATNGKVDADGLLRAIAASLGIADQASSVFLISHLIDMALRRLAYDNALHALKEQVFNDEQIIRMHQALQKSDNQKLSAAHCEAEIIATVFDILQFAYQPDPVAGPRADVNRLHKLAKYAKACHQAFPDDGNPPLDIPGLAVKQDPRTGVNQTVSLFLKVNRCLESDRPQVSDEVCQLIREFKNNPVNHILARQFVFDWSPSITITVWTEATRRATQLVYALFVEHNRTGQWPATLRDIPRLPAVIRTDPFSGKDFCYRIEKGQPLLYSVADNGKDDGGQHDPNWGKGWKSNTTTITDTDYVFWPIQPRKSKATGSRPH